MFEQATPEKPLEYHYTPSSNFREDLNNGCEQVESQPGYYGIIATKDFKIGDLIMKADPVSWIESIDSSDSVKLGWLNRLKLDLMELRDAKDLKNDGKTISEIGKLMMLLKSVTDSGKFPNQQEFLRKQVQDLLTQKWSKSDQHYRKFKKLYPRDLKELSGNIVFERNLENKFQKDTLLDLWKLKANIFLLESPIIGRERAALYWGPSLFNHSCCMNVIHATSPSDMSIQLFAMCNIKKGEELFIRYQGEEEYINTKKFISDYNFTCSCLLCSVEEGEKERIRSEIRRNLASFMILQKDNPKCCHHCLQVRDDLKICSKCRKVKYCGRICQKIDWAENHKAMCNKEI